MIWLNPSHFVDATVILAGPAKNCRPLLTAMRKALTPLSGLITMPVVVIWKCPQQYDTDLLPGGD
jgi:hypothetical protein